MGSITHVDKGNNELVNDVLYLVWSGVRLSDSNEGGIHVHNRFGPSVIVDVKAKQDLDSIFS